MRVVIIVPTYNERENIGRMAAALDRQADHLAGHELHLLVVDDTSPDGTADVVRGLRPARLQVHLVTGVKAGLGAAYVRGMRYALQMLQPDVVFEMDADFSHDPADVPRLLGEIVRGADFVIGSRYVEGGSIPDGWGWHRRLNSWLGNLVARNVAGIPGVQDCTAGFRAIRARLLARIDLGELKVQGYAFQVALLHAAQAVGARIVEVPVAFVDRTRGESKLGLRDIAEFVVNAWWIRFGSARTFVKFGLVGLSGVAVNMGVFALCLAAGMNKYAASPLAVECAIVTNFLANNLWTFRWRQSVDSVLARGLKFNAVALLALMVSSATFVGVSVVFPLAHPLLAQAVGILPALVVNYFLNAFWTFRDARERPVFGGWRFGSPEAGSARIRR
ncbi:MAG: glycosyltransferase family 2 protein [Betaproteobacteria bacterium]